MATFDEDYSACSALVVEGNPTARSLLITQLRDFGVGNVVGASRATDARRHLEYRTFDFVLCELHFDDDTTSGQDLLDDLRRNQLLPFSTVFIMITGEATYAKVAEAAESALDGYLLKPHKAAHLGDRLRQARVRKKSLQDIFTAIEREELDRAARLCAERFRSRDKFWLYAARVGAELMLRTGRFSDAQTLYQSVDDTKSLPWAKLGVARSQLDAGFANQAISTLENIISADSAYADAHDLLARAQFEQGRYDQALETYKVAATLTPASISRMQNLAMLTYHVGERPDAEKLLDRAVRMGVESKMFDCQVLVMLALLRLELGDRKGLQRCQDDFARILDKNPDNPRKLRLADIVATLTLIQQNQFALAVDAVSARAGAVITPAFDFESAGNLLALMSMLASKAIQVNEIDAVVETLGMRFCSNRAATELLLTGARVYPPYMERMKSCQAKVLDFAETAMALSLAGDPT
ncbi:MAG: response regulator, partial [Rhodoferax sp.]|nr:response regulator [Rhodoferax sp.]